MLCDVCWFMLRGHERLLWRGTYDLDFKHHESMETLRKSAELKCSICRTLLNTLEASPNSSQTGEAESLFITAKLSLQKRDIRNNLYRLDFKIQRDMCEAKRTFILKEIDSSSGQIVKFRTDRSRTTSSDEVLQLALRWIEECQCRIAVDPVYPKRLITWAESGSDPESVVKLVETNDWTTGRPPIQADDKRRYYVTLSHQRGGTPSVILTQDTLHRFKTDGIQLDDMPRTFREAIHFATHLEDVGYMWIDALCVVQDQRDDWLTQSVQMDQVYGNAYLNLSATASDNSEGGLYVGRAYQFLWEDAVDLNIAGISGLSRPTATNAELPVSRKAWTDPPELRRCVVLDASFWDELVNEAPVNKRAWVLQERVMAPRVLHFCKDQIAWECLECDKAETRPLGIPVFHLHSGDVVEGTRLKGRGTEPGIQLRKARLRTHTDPDRHLGPLIFAFELWRHIVEVYSKTRATEEQDKLVALSGIARWMATEIGTMKKPVPYVAGLWHKYLQSQLMWRVEPFFDPQTREFRHYSKRPSCYQAPSFSWASVNADETKGIKYGEVTDQGILIRIHDVEVQLESLDRPYGLLKGGRIFVSGKLRKAELFLFGGKHNSHSTNHAGWRLAGTGCTELEVEEHANVYLDCFEECFNKETAKAVNPFPIYCIPVAVGERIRNEDYIFCLLLEDAQDDKHDRGTFRRIGLTKLSPWADKLAHQRIRDNFVDDEYLPCLKYDWVAGEHLICII